MADGIKFPINDFDTLPPYEFAIEGRDQYSYTWILVVACVVAWFAAVAMGSNDVSSSFGTTVGSRAVTIKQALFISAIFQVLGAYFLGAKVVQTVGKSVVSLRSFEIRYDLLMLGMTITLLCTAIAVLLATFKEFPISTTQCVISSIIGFALASPGSPVNWNQVGLIFLGWLVAPLLAALISSTSFFLVRRFILRNKNAVPRTFILLPFLTWFAVALNFFFVLFVSPVAGRLGLSVGVGIGISIAVGFVPAIVLFVFRARLIKRVLQGPTPVVKHQDLTTVPGNLILRKSQEQMVTILRELDEEIEISDDAADKKHQDVSKSLAIILDNFQNVLSKVDEKTRVLLLRKEILKHLRTHNEKESREVVASVEGQEEHATHAPRRRMSIQVVTHLVDFEKQQKYFDDAEKQQSALHQKAEVFDPHAESAFRYLQIFTSITASFAQGANSIGNITGPLSIVEGIWSSSRFISGGAAVTEWVTWLGISGFVFGLFAFGYIVLTSVGVKMLHVSPSRGFCISLASSLILAIGSFIGLPLSTTHATIGAITGVGLLEKPYSETGEELHLNPWQSIKKAPVNWKFLLQVYATWFITVAFGISLGGAIFAFATFSPSQILPMNANNCLVFYAVPRNDSSFYIVDGGPTPGFVRGLIGYSNLTYVPL